MNILVTGKGSSGSWSIRGDQLGNAIGATVKSRCMDWTGYDMVIIVKKLAPGQQHAIAKYDGVIAWDIVDNWPQNFVKKISMARSHVYSFARKNNVDFCIFATEAQKEDLPLLDGFVLKHHARPKQKINPIRSVVKSVCYEGSERYIDYNLVNEIKRRGWKFVINPKNIADHDIVCGFRNDLWVSEVSERWKSNVKLANAMATGTPCLLPMESGYLEQHSHPMYYINTHGFKSGLDFLAKESERKRLALILRADTPHLEDIAQEYALSLLIYYGLAQDGLKKGKHL